jgi:hypothetical protein
MQSRVNTRNATTVLSISAGYIAGVMSFAPMKIEKQNIAIAMERTCPSDRIVATIPEAMPRYFLSTELIIALVLGEEKNA